MRRLNYYSLSQIEQLHDETGAESIFLTVSGKDGSLSHLGSYKGKKFLAEQNEIKSQFLGYCHNGKLDQSLLTGGVCRHLGLFIPLKDHDPFFSPVQNCIFKTTCRLLHNYG